MHEHDQDLIMALAEGTLDEAAAAAASAQISGCPECVRDLELQRIALSAFDDLPDVYLTAAESSQLHANLRRELDLGAPAVARPKPRFAWGRWLPAVGIATVFLVAVVSLPFLFGGGGDSSDMVAMDLTTTEAAAETTAAASAEAAPPRAGGALENMSDDAGTDIQAASEEMAEDGTATTAAAETTTTMSLMQPQDLLPLLGHVDELDREDLLEQLRTDRALLYNTSEEARSVDPFVSDCLDSNSSAANAASLGIPDNSDPVLLGVVYNDTGEEFLLVAYVPEDPGDTLFVTQRLYSCDIVSTLF